MATLKKTVLGRLSGAVGDVVFRELNGKNFVGLRALSFVPGSDQSSVERRSKFYLSTQLASTINSNFRLRSLWLRSIPSGKNVYNHLIKSNYSNLLYNNVGDLVKIVPGFGFSISSKGITISDTSVQVLTEAIGDNAGINPSVETKVQLAAIIYLSNPIDGSVKLQNFMSLLSLAQDIKLNEGFTFEINLSNQNQLIIKKYQSRKGFFSLLTLNVDDEVVNYSGTFVG